MRHPPYHLRLNKAVDRLLFVETLGRFADLFDLKGYTYYGLGGPFLEDFRVVSQWNPSLKLVSLESNWQTFRRQKRHRVSKRLTLVNHTVSDYLTHNLLNGEKCIAWLDYTDLSYQRLDEFSQLLGKVGEPSVIRITLRADSGDLPSRSVDLRNVVDAQVLDQLDDAKVADFNQVYRDFLRADVAPNDFVVVRRFVQVLQGMVQIAAEKALPAPGGIVFQFAQSSWYHDGTPMISVTGVVCRLEDRKAVRKVLGLAISGSDDWTDPAQIDVPELSLKERLLLEPHLPCDQASGRGLCRVLGYNVDDSAKQSVAKLKQYAVWYRYYPHFVRVEF